MHPLRQQPSKLHDTEKTLGWPTHRRYMSDIRKQSVFQPLEVKNVKKIWKLKCEMRVTRPYV